MTQAVDGNLVLKEKKEGFTFAGKGCGCERECECLVGVECVMNIVRALGMGSCLSLSFSRDHHRPSHPSSPSPFPSDGKRSRRLLRKRSSSSFDHIHRMEMRLHRIPGRMFLNGSTHNEVASLYCKQGRKGINQDAMLVWDNFCSKEDTIFCGVFDGHGPYGHRVAKKVRDSFPLKLNAHWDLHHNNKHDLKDSSKSEVEHIGFRLVKEKPTATDHEVDASNTFVTLTESFLKACKVMDKELKLHPDIDCFCSGTTAVTLVKHGHDLVIANVGDSRAVLGTRDHDDSLIAVQLTTDLKPNLPREAERIRLCKGRVFALRNEPEVARVWLPNADSPGLAMARAFGDFCLKDFGVISVPDVSYHRLTEKDEFVILATDGVWDVLANNEVVGIVASASRSSAARTLVESAAQAWRTKCPSSKVDDCSAVCLFFDSDSDLKTASTIDKLIPEASSEQSGVGSTVSADPKTLIDYDYSEFSRTCPEQSPLHGERRIGVEAEQERQ